MRRIRRVLLAILCIAAIPHLGLGAEWDGSSSTDWFTAANWDTNSVPTSSTDVRIRAGFSNYPVLNAQGAVCRELRVDSGGTLSLGVYTIDIYANLRVGNTSAISASATGVLRFNGSTAAFSEDPFTFSGDIECAKTGGSSVTWEDSQSLNDLIVTTGVCNLSLVANPKTQTISGNVTIASGATLNRVEATLNITGSLTNAGTFTDSNATGATTLAGNWTDTGTFTPGTRTVTFNGSGTSTIT
ncbi:MAG: hypothetical protein ACKVX7_13330, partial [Planctomycetota bacterium]